MEDILKTSIDKRLKTYFYYPLDFAFDQYTYGN